MNRFVRSCRSAWVRPLSVSLMLGCAVTTGWSQHYASARPVRSESAGTALQTNLGAPQMKPLVRVLADLERKYQVIFDFDNDLVKSKLVNVNALDRRIDNLEKVLTELLTPLDLVFEKFNTRSYLIYGKGTRIRTKQPGDKSTAEAGVPIGTSLPIAIPAIAEPISLLANRPVTFEAPADRPVTGTIIDATTNAGLPGVNVLVKGTGIGTSTDADGRFRLNVPDGRNTLVFSYIGYLTQEVDITSRNTVSISLATDDRALSEVVVVGYGTQKRSDLTGAVSSVKAADLKSLPATDINTALQGRVPGALVQQNSGEPGATSNIIIRGPASINGNSQPLYVVDGVPQGNPGYNFNIQDVESIEILKDASAAAIYGAQAGGGRCADYHQKGQSG